MNKIIIAIDGYSSCGKSTLAKELAQTLSYAYIDTGAMYRAVTLYIIKHKIDIQDSSQIEDALKQVQIHFKNIEGKNHTFLNHVNVEEEIRKMYVSNQVSNVAAISAVRRFLVKQQQAMGLKKGIVMDGRDIGTVVFPQAELKFFMTASPEVRAKRRFDELRSKNQNITLEEVLHNLQERDRIDTGRADSPLMQANDAIVIDNSNLSKQEQLQKVLDLVQLKIQEPII